MLLTMLEMLHARVRAFAPAKEATNHADDFELVKSLTRRPMLLQIFLSSGPHSSGSEQHAAYACQF